jgi:AcrR family transcriptional regulator
MTAATGQEDQRANQKTRTRQAVVDAAARLHRQGREPTVAQAAEEARVSRATAYRYFPTQEALLVEITGITPAAQPAEDQLAALPSQDTEERLLALLEAFNPAVLAEEPGMRRALLVYQDTWLRAHRGTATAPDTAREGRRMSWLDEVLRPVAGDLPAAQYRNLRAALALTLGIDSIVIMKDVAGLDNDQALHVLRWAATTLLRGALTPDPTQPSPP